MKLTDTTMPNIILVARVGFALCVLGILWLALDPQPITTAALFDLDKLNHLAAFMVLALLLDYSFPLSERFWLKWLPLLGFGALIELLQLLGGYRLFEWGDILADASGLIVYLALRPRLRALLDPKLGLIPS
jgi:hypothetical protein